MMIAHWNDKDLAEIVKYLKAHDKAPSYVRIKKFRLMTGQKYQMQYDQLIFKGVLH